MAAAAGVDPETPNDGDLGLSDWGRHLRADYRHDKLNPRTPYNIGGTAASYPTGGEASAEDAFAKYALNLPYISVNSMFKARLAGRVEFTLAEKTATYDGTAPQLFDGGNEVVGVVMDAGKYVTDYLGSQNAISFGMCIDPAGSSIKPSDRPVYYDPREKRVYIQLVQFGFDPTIIQGIWIIDSGGSSLVKSIWVMGNGELVDPVRRRPIGRLAGPAHELASIEGVDVSQLGGKPINQTEPDVAGFYTSIANATDAGGARADYYKIGKTLGDTMIIASAMPKFKRYEGAELVETRPNPYYGVDKGIGRGFGQTDVWKNHFNQNNDYPYDGAPASLMVKTGDQLNAVRAIFKGVPVVLERQSKGGKPKFFEFYPGNPSPMQVIAAIRTGYERLIIECTRRFDTLIASFERAIERDRATGASTGRIQYDYTKFVNEAGARFRFPNDPAKLAAAGALIERIVVPNLKLLKTACLAHIVARSGEIAMLPGMGEGVDPSTVTMEQLEAIKNIYTSHTQEMLQMSPQTTEIIAERIVKPIIYVSRVEPAGLGPIKNTEIHLLAAISGIADDTNSGNALILDRFVNRIPAAATAPVAPAEVQSAFTYLRLRLWEVVQSVLGAIRRAPVGGNRDLQVSLVVDPIPDSMGEATVRRDITADTVPLTVALSEYIAAHGGPSNPIERLTMIYNVLRMKDSPRIVDHVIRRRIEREFVTLKYIRFIDFPSVPLEGGTTFDIPPLPVDTPSSLGSRLFNAFVMHVNANNSQIGPTGPETMPRDELFVEMEALFLAGPSDTPTDPAVLALLTAELGVPPPAAEPGPMALGESGAAVVPPPAAAPGPVVPGGEAGAWPFAAVGAPAPLAFGSPRGSEPPARYPEVVKTGSEKLGPKASGPAKLAREREKAREAAALAAREKAREGRLDTRRTNTARAFGVLPPGVPMMRAGRRRTFRQKRSKKDKNAGNSA